MKISRVWAFGLFPALVMAGLRTVGAAPLDAPHSLHHVRTSEPHLVESHRRHATARAVSRAGTPAAKSTTAHGATGPTAARTTPRSGARGGLRRASLTTGRHQYYERFTASSFARGDIFAGDVTAGEDPVVRQAAIDALGDMNGTAVVIDPSNGRILAID